MGESSLFFRQILVPRLLKICSLICIILYVSVLYIGANLPVYTDEFLWKFFNSRLFLDHGKLIYGFPECKAGFLSDPPLTWLPARLVDALIYSNMSDPRIHRNVGLLGFIFLLLLLSAGFKKLFNRSYLVSVAVVASFFSLGTLPFLMILNRPEQTLLALLVLAILPLFYIETLLKYNEYKRDWTLTAYYLALSVIAFGVHPKSLYFSPVFLVVHFFLVGRSRAKIFSPILFSGVAFSAYETLKFWQRRTDCPESPWLTKVLGSLTLKPDLLYKDPRAFLRAGFSNIGSLNEYVQNMRFQSDYQNDWLPQAHFSPTHYEVFLNKLFYLPLYIAIGLIFFHTFRAFLRRNFNFQIMVTAGVLTASLFVTLFLQTNRNFYESGFILPLVWIILFVSFGFEKRTALNKSSDFIFLIVVICGTLQLGDLAHRSFPLSQKEWKQYHLDFKNQQASITNLAFGQCGLSSKGHLSNLIVDETAYTVFWDSSYPMFVHSVFGWWGTGLDYRQFIRDNPVEAIISVCSSLPKEYQAIATTERGICCIKDPKDRIH